MRKKKADQLAEIRIAEMIKMYQLGREEMWEFAIKTLHNLRHQDPLCDYPGECERDSGLVDAIHQITIQWKGNK
jgi:hypothetical protein